MTLDRKDNNLIVFCCVLSAWVIFFLDWDGSFSSVRSIFGLTILGFTTALVLTFRSNSRRLNGRRLGSFGFDYYDLLITVSGPISYMLYLAVSYLDKFASLQLLLPIGSLVYSLAVFIWVMRRRSIAEKKSAFTHSYLE